MEHELEERLILTLLLLAALEAELQLLLLDLFVDASGLACCINV
jgi:hypothetical protein